MSIFYKILRTATIAALAAMAVSCAKDTEVVDPYANWEDRNKEFLDSIADVVANPPAGEIWRKYRNYKIEFSDDINNPIKPYEYGNKDYVYVKFESEDDILTGDSQILYTDTVSVAYQGFLRNDVRFDGTYYGKFDKEFVDNFTKFAVGGVITGWTTALINMKPQTYVEMYIPYEMAYGESGDGTIPGSSVLKFEVYVDEVIKP